MNRTSRHSLPLLTLVLLSSLVTAPGAAQQSPAGGAPAPSGLSLRALLAGGTLRTVNRVATPIADSARDGVRLNELPNDGFAWATGTTLDVGSIELDLRGRDVPQRSFIGIAFHGAADGSAEVVYLRPFNFRAADPVRHKHAIQYVALPAYDFQRLRDEKPDRFENPVVPEPEATAWVHLRVVVSPDSVHAYVNRVTTPALSVPRLSTARGGEVGLWVGNNSDGEFANLSVRR
jgi:hypothetical protein